MSMRRAVAGCVVLMCLLALVAERTEGHITFFSPKEMMKMKQQNGKKDMETRSEDGQFEEVIVQQAPLVEHNGNSDNTEVAVLLLPRQMDQVPPALEEILH
ncbi:motilin-like [Girardinichthys multiradiatus]|uniref:motilin-like n=1 Tax=Girardinichthys multiradiatus TaxID=208333 RepID=UPI001FAC72C9|nr:motilin-like [Girardinichthys multiradiatus]XP_047203215.1 motilin-like [Girardinichthys multiradiatus]